MTENSAIHKAHAGKQGFPLTWGRHLVLSQSQPLTDSQAIMSPPFPNYT